jgi:hypothetical protein
MLDSCPLSIDSKCTPRAYSAKSGSGCCGLVERRCASSSWARPPNCGRPCTRGSAAKRGSPRAMHGRPSRPKKSGRGRRVAVLAQSTGRRRRALIFFFRSPFTSLFSPLCAARLGLCTVGLPCRRCVVWTRERMCDQFTHRSFHPADPFLFPSISSPPTPERCILVHIAASGRGLICWVRCGKESGAEHAGGGLDVDSFS